MVRSASIAEFLHIPELTQILRVLAWLTPFGAFSVLCEALLARNLRTKRVALRPLFSFTIATFLVGIPLAYAGFGYWSLVAMQATETVAAALALGFTARQLLVRPGLSRQAFYDLWPLSLGFTLNQPFIYLGQNADRIFIGRFLGTVSLGLYTRASFITTTAANLFGNIARLSMFPCPSAGAGRSSEVTERPVEVALAYCARHTSRDRVLRRFRRRAR